MKELIMDYCKQLRLGGHIANNYENIKANTYEEFLVKVLEIAVQNREVVKKNRSIQQAKFDVLKTFEGYEFNDIQIPSGTTVDEIKSVSFIDTKENLILYGPVGTGKTHLATSI